MGRSWSGLGWSWGNLGPILRHLGQAWGDLEPAGGAKNVDCPCVFSTLFAISHVLIRMVILAGLEAFLGASWDLLGTVLGFLVDFWSSQEATRDIGRSASRAFRDPPLPEAIS